MKWAAKFAGLVAALTLALGAALQWGPERSGSLMVSVGTTAFLLLWVYDRARR